MRILAAGDQHDGCYDVVKVLCAYGADMRAVDTSGATAMSAAGSVHGPEVALGHTACPPGAQTFPWLQMVEGWSALQIAAAIGVPEQAEAALRLGLIDTAGCSLPELMSSAATLLPKPGYRLWCQEHRDIIAGQHPSWSSAEVSSMMNEMYNRLDRETSKSWCARQKLLAPEEPLRVTISTQSMVKEVGEPPGTPHVIVTVLASTTDEDGG